MDFQKHTGWEETLRKGLEEIRKTWKELRCFVTNVPKNRLEYQVWRIRMGLVVIWSLSGLIIIESLILRG